VVYTKSKQEFLEMMTISETCDKCGAYVPDGHGPFCKNCLTEEKARLETVYTSVERQFSTNRFTASLVDEDGYIVLAREGITDQRTALAIAEAMFAGYKTGIGLSGHRLK
jgi:hypothetical protein